MSFRTLWSAVLFLLVARSEASAYTDPGTGALLWQVLAAGFVGFMFYFRRIVNWLRPKKDKGDEEVG